MLKIMMGMLGGMIIIVAIFLGPLSHNSAAGRAGEPLESESVDSEEEINPQLIQDTLVQAGDNIRDEEIRGYYNQLLEEYNLPEGSHISITGEDGQYIVLPDMDNVIQKALTLPLVEAGVNIEDEEISRFYHALLQESGWTIEK